MDERATFEKWAGSVGLNLNRSRRTAGMYEAMDTNLIWEGWQASAFAAPEAPALQKMTMQGWKLVPLEPTKEMILAGFFLPNLTWSDVRGCYKDMLAAAPEAPRPVTPEEDAVMQSALRKSSTLVAPGRIAAPEAPGELPKPTLYRIQLVWKQTGGLGETEYAYSEKAAEVLADFMRKDTAHYGNEAEVVVTPFIPRAAVAAALAAPAGEPGWLAEAERLLDFAQSDHWMHATAEAADWDDWEVRKHDAAVSRAALLAHLRTRPSVAAPAGDPDIDYSLEKGDMVTYRGWWDGKRAMEVVDVNWALRAVALKLSPEGGIVIWSASGLTKVEHTLPSAEQEQA